MGSFNLIGLRPEIAWARSEVGHFEGDLIIGARGVSAIVTLIDRASRFNLIGDLPEGHDATSVLACCIELIERVPLEARKTLTWDPGTEMARHDDLASAVSIDVSLPSLKGPETLQPGLTSRNSLSEAHPPWPCPSSTVSSGASSRPFVSTG